MKRFLLLVPALAILGALAAWWFSPTQIVKRRTLDFISTADVPETMSDLARSARGNNLAPFLAERIEIDAPESVARYAPDHLDRTRFTALYTAAARGAKRISLEDPELESVEIDGDLAVVELRLDAIVEVGRRRPADGIQNITLTWRNSDQGWRITHAAWAETPR